MSDRMYFAQKLRIGCEVALVLLYRKLAAMGVPADRGVPFVDPFADAKAEGEPFAEESSWRRTGGI
jgi:hypothetical protein